VPVAVATARWTLVRQVMCSLPRSPLGPVTVTCASIVSERRSQTAGPEMRSPGTNRASWKTSLTGEWAALDPPHGLQRRLRGLGATVDLEVHGDRPQRRPAPVERHVERSAQHTRLARARGDLDADGRGRGAGDGHQGQRCEPDQEPAEHPMTIRGRGRVR
jgi:hypothetical protein